MVRVIPEGMRVKICISTTDRTKSSILWSCNHGYLKKKKPEAGGTRMEKQSGVCGYALVATIKFVNATERFWLGIIISCVKL